MLKINDDKKIKKLEDIDAVKKYLSRIFTVLPKDVREKLMNLNTSEEMKNLIKKELAFLISEEKQNEYLDELYRIYNRLLNEF